MTESQKAEAMLHLNSFNQPGKLSGIHAWISMILHLIFMKKGTYTTNPEMGIGIQSYEYSFIDDAIPKLQEEITEQVRTYLPEVPFNSVTLLTKDSAEYKQKLLIMVLNFDDGAGDIQTAVVASINSNNRIDFDISI